MSALGLLDKFAGRVIEEAAKRVGEEIKKKQTAEQKPRPPTVTARGVSLSEVRLRQAGEQPQEHEKVKCVGERGAKGRLKELMPQQ